METCFPETIRETNPDGIRITCFTELQLPDSILRANPAYDVGPWFDYMSTTFINEEDDVYVAPAHVELMYFYPANPKLQLSVVHPAFGTHMEHSVLTTMYRMEYMDDCQCISNCEETVDWET